MGSLIYTVNCSVDGYINDADGDIQWGAPSPEVFAFIVDTLSRVQTELYGRRTYELMTVWETDPSLGAAGEREQEFADWWKRTPKVVYSTTLPEEGVITGNTRLVRGFDAAEVRRLVEQTPGDVSIFGPTLAAHAFDAGLVDEVMLHIRPVTVGGGMRVLPPARLALDLLEQRRFEDGAVYLRYAVRR